MSQPVVLPAKDKPTESLLKRRADRVTMDSSISVRGMDASGAAFSDETKTQVLSRLGATISLKRVLSPGSLITVRNLATGGEAPCRVVDQVGGGADGYVYGISLMDPTLNLWGINFPPMAKSRNAAARLLLHCGECRTPEVVYFDEMEAEVFAAHAAISRFCSGCQRRTIWQAGAQELQSHPILFVRPRTTNDRTQPRVQARLRSCIRQPGFGDEMLFSENLSRGGLSFKSPSHYYPGSIIHVAVPYSPGAGNVFVPARVIYARPIPAEGFLQHGAAYIQSP